MQSPLSLTTVYRKPVDNKPRFYFDNRPDNKPFSVSCDPKTSKVRPLVTILLLMSLPALGQVNKHGPPCGGMDIIDVGFHIKGMPVQNSGPIRYSEISAKQLRKGVTLVLKDTSYKIHWLLVNYNSGRGNKEYPINGNKITTKNAIFLKSVKPGDTLSFECINVTRNGLLSLSTTFEVLVTN